MTAPIRMTRRTPPNDASSFRLFLIQIAALMISHPERFDSQDTDIGVAAVGWNSLQDCEDFLQIPQIDLVCWFNKTLETWLTRNGLIDACQGELSIRYLDALRIIDRTSTSIARGEIPKSASPGLSAADTL